MEQNLSPEVDYLAKENSLIEQQGELEALSFRIPMTEQALTEIGQKVTHHRADFRSTALNELSQRRAELRALDEIITAGKDRVTRTDVKSPVRGTVKQLNITTVGELWGRVNR